jgi:multiple sugar transport system substrate-binding protein
MKRGLLVTLLIIALVAPFGLVHAQGEPITIRFWHTYNEVSPENQMLVETLIPLFEAAHPGIRVQSVPFPYGEFRQTIITSLAGEEGPDLARLDIIWSPEFADLGALEALDEVMPDFEALAAEVFPGPLSTNFYEGHYYGLPLDTNTRVWLWNETVYAQAGISEPPATIDDLRAQCEAIRALGEDMYVFGDGGTYGWAVLPWIWSFGGSLTDPDITTATGYVNSPETVAAYTFLRDMIADGCFSPSFFGGVDSANQYFTNRFSAILDGPWMFPIGEAQFPDFTLRTALMPAGEGGSISVVGGENIALFRHPRPDQARLEAALEFLRFTQSDEYQLRMSETGQLTVLPRLLETEYYQNHPYYGVYLEQLETARARTPHPAWNRMEEQLTNMGQMILRGEVEPQEGLDELASILDGMLR